MLRLMRAITRAAAACTLSLGLIACGPTKSVEIDVIAAAVTHIYGSRQPSDTASRAALLTGPNTHAWSADHSAWLRHRLGGHPDLTADLARRNSKPLALIELGRAVPSAVPLRIVRADSMNQLGRDVGERGITAGGGRDPILLTVSRPGFGDSGRAAVVYLQHQGRNRCGGGGFAFMRKEGDRWVVDSLRVVYVT